MSIRIGRMLATVMAMALLAGVGLFAQQGKLEVVGGGTYDWGKSDPGKLKARVQLKNVGTGPISILEVRPTCLCTIAPVDRKFLAAGDIATVDITLDVTTRVGRIERNIRILSVDSSSASRVVDTAWIYLKADVHVDLNVSPASTLVVGQAKIGKEAHVLPLKIRNVSEHPITVEPPVLLDGANVAVSFEMKEKKTLAPGEEFEFRSSVTANLPGPMKGVVILRTSSEKMPVLRLPVTGTVAANAAPPTAPTTAH